MSVSNAAIFARVAAQYRKELQRVPARRETPKSATSRAPTPNRTASKPAQPGKQRPATAPLFAHLNHAAAYDDEPDLYDGVVEQKRVATANDIMAAAAKARTPTGSATPPTGFAAKVLAAGAKARGENVAGPPMTEFAKRVIEAGKKRRGERL